VPAGPLDALRGGDLAALASAYAEDARLDMSVPGGRAVARGREEAAALLLDHFRSGVEAGDWRAREFPDGAAVTLVRSPWRQRHYLHLSDGKVTAHWIYAAGEVAGGDGTIPTGVLDLAGPGGEVLGAVGGGNSGADLIRLRTADGRGLVAKRLSDGGDWLGRATSRLNDAGPRLTPRSGGVRSADLWRAGVFDRITGFDTAIERAVELDGVWWLVMRDVAHALLGDERRLTRQESRRILAAAAAMHAEFLGEAPASLATLEARLGASSPALAEAERTGHDLVPKQLPAAWDAFEQAFARDVAGPIRALAANPAPLVGRMRRSAWTLLHGDLRDDNLGLEGDTIYLLDWDLASCGPPAVDFAWYLMHDAWRIDASHDEVVADFLEAEGEAVDADDLALGLVAGLVMYGWLVGHSAVVHPDPAERAWAAAEIAWWEPRVRDALAVQGLLR
jgi:hypothetical protein